MRGNYSYLTPTNEKFGPIESAAPFIDAFDATEDARLMCPGDGNHTVAWIEIYSPSTAENPPIQARYFLNGNGVFAGPFKPSIDA